MDKVVNRKDGTLTIKNIPCRSEIRRKMKYLIEKIDDLENIIQAGKSNTKSAIEYE